MYEITRGKVQKAKKVVLYGVEGVGKTTFAAQFPGAVFIDTEGSSEEYDLARFPKPSSWQMLLGEIQQVVNNPGLCKTLVIDTLDWAEKMAYDHVCSMKGWDSIESPGYGAGYRYAFEEMGKLLNLLTMVVDRGVHVVLTAHAAIRKFEQPDEMGGYDRWEMKLQTSNKCNTAAMVREFADIVLFANYETIVVKNEDKKNRAQGGRRVMYTTHHPCWDAKNRFGLPDKLPFEYAKVAHCFQMAEPAADHIAASVSPPAEQNPTTAGNFSPEVTQNVLSDRPGGIPDALWDLMTAVGVTEDQIRAVVSKRGYYPVDTPISNYDPAFISGVLIGAWQQVYQMIKGE